jgi:hypothetical protein
MYALLSQRHARHQGVQSVLDMLKLQPYLQSGGNETVGQGWFAVKTVT